MPGRGSSAGERVATGLRAPRGLSKALVLTAAAQSGSGRLARPDAPHATPRDATPRHATLSRVMSRHVTPHATPRYTASRHVTPHARHTTSRYAASRHASRHATSRYASRHATPCHATLHRATLRLTSRHAAPHRAAPRRVRPGVGAQVPAKRWRRVQLTDSRHSVL